MLLSSCSVAMDEEFGMLVCTREILLESAKFH